MYFAYHHANVEQKSLLNALVGKQDLTTQEAEIVKAIIQEHGVQSTKACMHKYAEKALVVIETLAYSDTYKQWWKELVEYLVAREI